jgi:phosphonate transport system permease protein
VREDRVVEARSFGATDWRPPSALPARWMGPLLALSLGAFVLWNVLSLQVDPARVARGLSRAGIVFGRAFPPDFGRWQLLVEGVLESLQMATLSTAFGVLIGIPIAVMAAHNFAPRLVYALGRGIISLGRTFHEIIVAILFVKAVGFGPFAGMLTLTWGSLGFFGKLLAEQIENIDRGQVEAIRATGAGRAAVLVFAVVPQVLPRIIGLTIYQWDIHLRQSAIIGIVGAGGIGTTLYNSFARYDYDFSMAILLVIVAIVLLGEAVSAVARKRIQ